LRIWETQERFLRNFARSGKFVRSADATGISKQCIYKWEKADKFSFNKRMEIAHQEYVERMEAELDRFIEESPHNTQILRIFRLKAEWPEKYGDHVQITTDAPVKQMLYQFAPTVSYMPAPFDKLWATGLTYDAIRWNWY
jgi:hypothetical protein